MHREIDSVDDKQTMITATGRALIRIVKEEQIAPKFSPKIQCQMSRPPHFCQDNNQILKKLSWAMSIMTHSR